MNALQPGVEFSCDLFAQFRWLDGPGVPSESQDPSRDIVDFLELESDVTPSVPFFFGFKPRRNSPARALVSFGREGNLEVDFVGLASIGYEVLFEVEVLWFLERFVEYDQFGYPVEPEVARV